VILDDGGRLRLHSVPIILSHRVIGAVQAGQPLRDVDAAMQQVRTVLTTGGLLALAAVGAVGWWMSWLALRPIDRITQAAAHIAGTRDLGPRLPLPKARDEVGRLVSTFNALLDRLARVIDAQQRLGADVSHELRTPLTTIRGNVDLLRRGAADDLRERAVALDAIEVEVNRMSRMVADLLLLAQADAGMRLEKQPVEMDTLLLQVYRQAQTIAAVSFPGSERVAIRLGHEDQAVVMGDPDRLRQLLLNLIDNALKYTPRGGSVTLSLYREAGWVRILVQDSGVGIPPEVLLHVFDRFYRAPRQGRQGVGLGLSIARWIAEAHDGRLEVESEVDRGSTFTLWLPEGETIPA
jgi:signal transduction histidine kinase